MSCQVDPRGADVHGRVDDQVALQTCAETSPPSLRSARYEMDEVLFRTALSPGIEEDDVLMTSDPYSCGAAISHANDWLVVLPIFYEGRIVGWASQFGHMSDVGGKPPASMPTDARTTFEEGVVIPPFKLYKKGVLDDDALRIILNQVRQPDWNRADLNGIVAACRTAARRVQEMCARFGVDTYTSALDDLLDRNYGR